MTRSTTLVLAALLLAPASLSAQSASWTLCQAAGLRSCGAFELQLTTGATSTDVTVRARNLQGSHPLSATWWTTITQIDFFTAAPAFPMVQDHNVAETPIGMVAGSTTSWSSFDRGTRFGVWNGSLEEVSYVGYQGIGGCVATADVISPSTGIGYGQGYRTCDGSGLTGSLELSFVIPRSVTLAQITAMQFFSANPEVMSDEFPSACRSGTASCLSVTAASAVVPEPATIVLTMSGLLALGAVVRRRRA